MCTKGNCKTRNCKTKNCKTTLEEQVSTLYKSLASIVNEVNGNSVILVSLIEMMIDDGTIDADKLNSFIDETYKKFR